MSRESFAQRYGGSSSAPAGTSATRPTTWREARQKAKGVWDAKSGRRKEPASVITTASEPNADQPSWVVTLFKLACLVVLGIALGAALAFSPVGIVFPKQVSTWIQSGLSLAAIVLVGMAVFRWWKNRGLKDKSLAKSPKGLVGMAVFLLILGLVLVGVSLSLSMLIVMLLAVLVIALDAIVGVKWRLAIVVALALVGVVMTTYWAIAPRDANGAPVPQLSDAQKIAISHTYAGPSVPGQSVDDKIKAGGNILVGVADQLYAQYTTARDHCNANSGKPGDSDAVGAYNFCQSEIWGDANAKAPGSKKVLQDQVKSVCAIAQADMSPCDQKYLDFAKASSYTP